MAIRKIEPTTNVNCSTPNDNQSHTSPKLSYIATTHQGIPIIEPFKNDLIKALQSNSPVITRLQNEPK